MSVSLPRCVIRLLRQPVPCSPPCILLLVFDSYQFSPLACFGLRIETRSAVDNQFDLRGLFSLFHWLSWITWQGTAMHQGGHLHKHKCGTKLSLHFLKKKLDTLFGEVGGRRNIFIHSIPGLRLRGS